MKYSKALKGRYKPKNPEKYVGDHTNIIHRSGMERTLMIKFDTHPNVLRWASEEMGIPYKCPVTGKRRKYYPDFVIEQINKKGHREIIMIEVKPYKETVAPKPRSRKTKAYLQEQTTYATNMRKWEAARNYCDLQGWRFVVMTEREIGGTK